MAEMDDQELFSSAIADDPIPEVTEQPAEAPVPETPRQDDRSRDEQGRFASRQAAEPEPAPQAETPVAKDEAYVPPWRLREIRDERDAINQRYLDTQRQLEMLRQSQPKPEPIPKPDLFESPDGAIEYGVKQYVDPVIQELRERVAAQDERYRLRNERSSRDRAIEKYGAENLQAGYKWLGEAMQTDPDAKRFYETRIHHVDAEDPFEDLMKAYRQHQISSDPDGWALKRAAELNAQNGQPQQQQSRQPSSQQPQGSNIKLPPTLRSVPAARGAVEDDTDMSDAALFRYATR